MSDALYQQAIKNLARAAHGAGRLEIPDGSALRDNPLCGDRVRMEITRHDGMISTLGHDTRGCLLCRASASLIGRHAIGQDQAGIQAAQQALEQLLTQPDPPAALPWPELALFVPAQPFPSRHGCVLLPFQTLLAELKDRDDKE